MHHLSMHVCSSCLSSSLLHTSVRLELLITAWSDAHTNGNLCIRNLTLNESLNEKCKFLFDRPILRKNIHNYLKLFISFEQKVALAYNRKTSRFSLIKRTSLPLSASLNLYLSFSPSSPLSVSYYTISHFFSLILSISISRSKDKIFSLPLYKFSRKNLFVSFFLKSRNHALLENWPRF